MRENFDASPLATLSYIEKREEKDSRYTGGISPCSKTVYQTCNIMYICNTELKVPAE